MSYSHPKRKETPGWIITREIAMTTLDSIKEVLFVVSCLAFIPILIILALIGFLLLLATAIIITIALVPVAIVAMLCDVEISCNK